MRDEFDLVIRNARIFDGTGGPAETADLGVKNGRISARGADLGAGREEIDAAGGWLFPGFLDIHTHYDLEVELAPGLPESVRHGTTTVVVSNCSLGLAFGAQREDGQDPIVDCFARVENIPKPVLKKVADKVTWNHSDAYLDHLDGLNLGPNIAPMIPYSMLRIAAMGVEASVTRDPTEAELTEMESLLEKGMQEGYCGFSSDGLPFHYLSNDPHRERRIPSQYAGYSELKRLTGIVRRFDRVWQATPPTESPLKIFRNFLLSSGRLFGKPLKITAVAALDVRSNRNTIRKAYTLARILNSALFKGNFVLQSLAARFKVWSDGAYTPLAEEIPELRALAMLDIEDSAGRQRLYADAAFEAKFKAMWRKGKSGVSLARLKRVLRMETYAFRRSAKEMRIESAPVDVWAGDDFAAIADRLMRYQADEPTARSDQERDAFDQFPPVRDDADFVFGALKLFDRELYWSTVSANADMETVRKLTMDKTFLPGFADSGAHLTNMAFYDINLRALRIAWEENAEAGVCYMARRLTRDPAEFFDLDAGTLEIGAQADFVLIEPDTLKSYDGEANVRRVYRDILEHEQLVNRSDGVVLGVWINGHRAFGANGISEELGSTRFGRLLRARDSVRQASAMAAE